MATFPLLPEPSDDAAPPLPPPSDSALPAFDLPTLFGRGLTAPFRRDAATDFASGANEALVRSAMAQVLATRADDGRVSGELPWRPEFGSLLHRLQYLNTDAVFDALVRTRVIGALSRWEPRCRVRDVSVSRVDSGRGDLVTLIHVRYDLVQTATGSVLASGQTLTVPISG